MKRDKILVPRRLEDRDKRWSDHINKILQKKHITGNLDLSDTDIVDLGNIETISGSLYLDNCQNLKSLGKLTTIKNCLHILDCPKLTSLNNIQVKIIFVSADECNLDGETLKKYKLN